MATYVHHQKKKICRRLALYYGCVTRNCLLVVKVTEYCATLASLVYTRHVAGLP